MVMNQKELSVGVSITNTKDSFNEEFGKKIAYSKAKSNKKSFMLTNRPGFINEDVVNALLANYVKVYSERSRFSNSWI